MQLSRFALIGVSALALSLGACGQKDKGGSALKSAEMAALNLDNNDIKVFAPYFAVPERKISDTDADAALAAMGLATANPNGLSWASREGSGGTYVFTDLTSKTENDGTVLIGTATLYGVRQIKGDDDVMRPTFDRADFQILTITDEDVVFTADTLSVAKPSPAMALSIVDALNETADMGTMNFSEDDLQFGAISATNLRAKSEELDGMIEQFTWAVDDNTQRGDGEIGKISLRIVTPRVEDISAAEAPSGGTSAADAPASSDNVTTFEFEGGSVRGFNTAGFGVDKSAAGAAGMLQQLNMFDTPYDSFTLGKGEFKSSAFNLRFEGAEGQSVRTGKITTITQNMKPLTISFDAKKLAGLGGRASTAVQMIDTLGFDEMVFRSSSRSILDEANDEVRVEDGLLVMEDGFRLNLEYAAQGLKQMQATAAKQAENNRSTALRNALMTAETTEGYEDDVAAMEALMTYQSEQMNDLLGPLKIKSMRMSLEDNSIVERSLKLASEMTGQSEKNIKRSLAMAVIGAPMMGRNDLESDMLGQAASAFAGFVKEGGTLTLQIAPPEPLPLSELMEDNGGNITPERLGFTARHDTPAGP